MPSDRVRRQRGRGSVAVAKFDKRLRSILIKRAGLDPALADEAIATAERDGKSLTEVLLERKAIDERVLIASVAAEMRLPPIDVKRVTIEEPVLKALPQDLARYYGVLPIAKIGDTLTVAVSNPFDILKLDDIRIVTGCQIRPVVSTETAIQDGIAQAYDRTAEKLEDLYQDLAASDLELVEDAPETDDEVPADENSPVVKLVNLIIRQAVMNRVSDIHIEPMEKRLRVRFRKDGVLYEFKHKGQDLPKRLQGAIASRIKIMSQLNIAEKRVPQDGKLRLKIEDRKVDFRVSTLPTIHGEKIVMRILDSSSLALDLEQLGFEPQALEAFRKALAQPYGMVLVTGPTGSGKTTTLYSALKALMTVEDNVVTVEDPVEYQLDGVNQVAVNPKRGMTFAAALRSILRQDPDTVMVGEMRDLETVQIAIRAALTGHLVLSTLHTNDSASTITRLIDMGVDPFLVTSTVVLASAQRLLRKLCGECREPTEVPRERLLGVGYTEEEAQRILDGEVTLYKARGCGRCSNGYSGRFAVLEAMYMTDEIRRLVLAGESAVEIKERAVEQGMITLRRCGLLNALRGRTSIEEVLRMTTEDVATAKQY
ncbi:MAG: type II secretion system protein GspE [Planctomycetota bacterium]|nr:MAG: type II secretion system protein GspE [Planctomycetota bacterium]